MKLKYQYNPYFLSEDSTELDSAGITAIHDSGYDRRGNWWRRLLRIFGEENTPYRLSGPLIKGDKLIWHSVHTPQPCPLIRIVRFDWPLDKKHWQVICVIENGDDANSLRPFQLYEYEVREQCERLGTAPSTSDGFVKALFARIHPKSK